MAAVTVLVADLRGHTIRPDERAATGSASSTTADDPGVAPLNRVVTPDLLVVSPRRISPAAVAEVERSRTVTETLRVRAGRVRLGSKRAGLLGVDPSVFRAWTPLASAKSDALWRALAHDQLVLSFAARDAHRVGLDRTYPVTGSRTLPMRLGGVAELRLAGVDGLVTEPTADGLGLTADTGMLVNAPAVPMPVLKRLVRKAVGADARLVRLRPQATAGPRPERGDGTAAADSYRELYEFAASRCTGLSWTVLAAIGQVESGHGRNMGPSSAGALGPMQFMPATWRSYGVDGDGDGDRDVWDPRDAVPAAADYLCASGAGDGGRSLYRAVYAYNHSDAYVREVLATAAVYAASG
ncbi:MAG: transglycosylase SLT domain-containing protein [Streptosporangiales bacterium]|nr:transglycosylase SLT domain-containing protein [Streptosporangiales bacterium]